MKDYKPVNADGVAVVIIWKNKILLVKRRNIPFIFNRGIWGFVTGSRKKGESYASTAYREAEEETGISEKSLKQLMNPIRVWMFDKRKKKRWQNYLFIFRSNTNKAKLNIENSKLRWADMNEIKEGNDYTNIFLNKNKVIVNIEKCLRNERHYR